MRSRGIVCYNKQMKVETVRKVVGGILFTVALMLAGCGSSSTSGSGGGSGQNASSGSKDLSSIAKQPDISWHSSYLTGKHESFGCGDTCHTPSLTAKTATGSAGYQLTSDRKQICYQCHAPNYNASSSFNHSSSNTGTYCNACHYSDSFRTHSRLSPDQYHSNISSGCATCHSNRYPPSHANSGRTSGCESCHSYKNGSWSLTAGAHNYTSGCSTCHIGKKPASHANRPNTCENCHAYPSWAGARVDHSSITSGCSTCHIGKKPASHANRPDTCESCHSTSSWAGAGMNHSGITSGCSSCHIGKKPASHSNRPNTCESCHSTSTWSGARMNHSGVSGGCANCHNKHYSGYACEGCHTSGFSWSFSHNRVSSSNCKACHAGGGGNDGGGGGNGGGNDGGGGGGNDGGGGRDD